MTDQDKWFTPKIRYGAELGYVMLQLPHIELPAFNYEGIAYEPKQELHCSLLCTRKLAEIFQDPESADSTIAAFVEKFVQENSITFDGFTDKTYVCEEDEVKSIVIGAKIGGIDQLFTTLTEKFPELTTLANPALHVTLYKYNHQFGIGIQNEAQLRELCRPIPLDVLPAIIKEKI